jgi:hypothetical protein
MASAGAISISFSTPSIDLSGGAVTDTITISGLKAAGQAVTSYDLLVDFNPTQLSVTGIMNGTLPDDAMSGGPSNSVSGGVITLTDSSPDGNSAFSGQADPFTLATITFLPLVSTGTSSLGFDLADSRVTGFGPAGCVLSQCGAVLTLTPGRGGATVPEPSGFPLFGLGLSALGFAVARRRRGGAGLRG